MCRSAVVMQRQTVQKDTSGGPTRTWAAAGDAIRADIQPAGSRIQEFYQRRDLSCSHTIYLVRDPGPTADCRFQTSDGLRTFVLVGRRPPAAGYHQWPCVVDVDEILLPSS